MRNQTMSYKTAFFLCLLLLCSVQSVSRAGAAEPKQIQAPDFNRQIATIFRKYCNSCHNSEDAEGGLVLESYQKMMAGGENGPVVVPGKLATSRLFLTVEKKDEPFMPPDDQKGPTDKEIALLKSWIESGAKNSLIKSSVGLVTPKIAVKGKARQPINSVAYSPDGKFVAVAKYREVEIQNSTTGKTVSKLTGHSGTVTKVGFSADGKLLFAACGETGIFGEVRLWKTADWTLARTIKGHRDSLYAGAISPNGKILATGSYDKEIKLWDVETGKEIRTLSGHNGPVFDLAFHPSGKILASACDDFTIKLWNVESGKRLDTLNQPTKPQYAVAFSPNGKYVVAAGVDNRIRIWEIRQNGKEGTNVILHSRFAHEGPIIDLAFSPDGRALLSSSEDLSIKSWETTSFTQQKTWKNQPDWPAAVAVSPSNNEFIVGRLDGSQQKLSLSTQAQTTNESVKPVSDLATPVTTEPSSPEQPLPLVKEVEPNDKPQSATVVKTPGHAEGVLNQKDATEIDLFRFHAEAGHPLIIETNAARQKSKADTKIEILHVDGRPVQRLLLRAVRDSQINFRPIDSSQDVVRVDNWREMELNEYLYMDGEIGKIFRLPEGPDSGFLFYKVNGKRRSYFDTTPTVHAKDSPVYIVEPYPAGTELKDNGLPIFPLYYANDDDGRRKLGADSQLTFTAPKTDDYLVRVSDVRGQSGADYKYKLTIRNPRPDYKVTIEGKSRTISKGNGQRIKLQLARLDGFAGDVAVHIQNLPDGYQVASPVVIEAGHLLAQTVITASSDAKPMTKEQWSEIKVSSTAEINGKEVKHEVGNLAEIKLAEKDAKIALTLEVDPTSKNKSPDGSLNIQPGTSITALLKIERRGADGAIRFDVENLPHGIVVDNLGLSGLTLLPGQNERRIFLTARDWVPESSRLIFAVSRSEGSQASHPIWLHVKPAEKVADTQ